MRNAIQIGTLECITDSMAAFAVLEEINGRTRLFETARQFAGVPRTDPRGVAFVLLEIGLCGVGSHTLFA